jgi:hypothetical protein
MNIPGFAADATLYRTSTHYRSTSGIHDRNASGRVELQQMNLGERGVFARPTPVIETYHDSSLLLREHKLLPILETQGWTVQGCHLVWEGMTTGRTERRCYTKQYLRPVSSGLSECPGADKSGSLCYPFCDPGFHGAGPYCWQDCPPGYADDGATCRFDGPAVISADTSGCPSYDLCCTWSEDATCPLGYNRTACTCNANIFLKASYWRGAGWPMSCPTGLEQVGALCYGNCDSGYVASGIYCNDTKQTCEDVPVKTPPDWSQLKRFCFARHNPDSPYVEPCIPASAWADTEDHAKQMLQCQCTNCTFDRVDCSTLDAGMACR